MNQVLDESYRPSKNFFSSDLILSSFLKRKLSNGGYSYMADKLDRIGKSAALEMNPLAMEADKHGPILVKRNFLGKNCCEFCHLANCFVYLNGTISYGNSTGIITTIFQSVEPFH